MIKKREQFRPVFCHTLVQCPCSFRFKYLIGQLPKERRPSPNVQALEAHGGDHAQQHR